MPLAPGSAVLLPASATPDARLSTVRARDAQGMVVLVALWVVPAAVALGQLSLDRALAGVPLDWHLALWTTLPNWALWMLLTPPVAWLAAQTRPDRLSTGGVAAAHAVGACVALGAQAAGNVAAFRVGGLPAAWTWETVGTHVELRLPVNLLAYALLVAAVWAHLAMRDARQRAVLAERAEGDALRAAHAAAAAAREADALRAALAESRLGALQMQVRPHFLFNAMHAIAATVRRGDGSAAVTMLARLGDLLRLSLDDDGAALVPLGRELDVLDPYLALEQARFGDRLTVEWDVAPEARDVAVPPWIVQPLVENAMKHAVACTSGPCRIAVRARLVDANGRAGVRIDVEDDGPGIGADGAALQAPARTWTGTADVSGEASCGASGVGLANLRARLRGLWGDAATLRLEPGADGRGLRAVLDLPGDARAPRGSGGDGATAGTAEAVQRTGGAS